MSSKDGGIKTLLEAETKATESVQQARREKTARIKQARDEAHAEVKQYLAQQEAILAQKKSEGMTDSSKSSKLAAETESQLMEIRRNSEANRVNVVRKILEWVSTVDTTPPPKAA